MNWDEKSTNERGPFLVGLLVLSCRYMRFLFCPACSSRPSTKYFFLTAHFFNSFVPHCPASWAGSRAGSPVSWYVALGTMHEFIVVLLYNKSSASSLYCKRTDATYPKAPLRISLGSERVFLFRHYSSTVHSKS